MNSSTHDHNDMFDPPLPPIIAAATPSSDEKARPCLDGIISISSGGGPNGLVVAPLKPNHTHIISESLPSSPSSSSSSSSEEMNSKRVSFQGGSFKSQQPSKDYSSSLKSRSSSTTTMTKNNKVGMSNLVYLTYVHETKEMILHDQNCNEVWAVIRSTLEVTNNNNNNNNNNQARTSSIFTTKKQHQQPKQFTIYGITPMYSGQQHAAETSAGRLSPHDVVLRGMIQKETTKKNYDEEKEITNNSSSEISDGGHAKKDQEIVLLYEWAIIEAKHSRSSLFLSPGKLRLCLELAAKTREETTRFVAKEFSKTPEKKWIATIQKDAKEGKKISSIPLHHSERSSQMMMRKKEKRSSSPTTSAAVGTKIDPKSCVSFLACTQEFIEMVCCS